MRIVLSTAAQSQRFWGMEGKSDGDDMTTAYSEWAGAGNLWRVEDTPARSGSRSSSVRNAGATDTYTRTLTSDESSAESIDFSFYYYWDGVGNSLFNTFMSLGISTTDVMIIWIQTQVFTGTPKYRIFFDMNKSGGSDTQAAYKGQLGGSIEANFINYPSSAWRGLKIIWLQVQKKVEVYADEDNSDVWTLVHTETWPDQQSPTNTLMRSSSSTRGFDSFYYDDILFDAHLSSETTELSSLSVVECSKRLEGAGAFLAVKPDFEMATFATLKNYIWTTIEVWNNELTKKLGEYYGIFLSIQRNAVTFRGPEALKVLDKVGSRYNGVLASGEVTGTGGAGTPTIDDINAAFTAALVTKICTFQDVSGPNTETAYPDSASDHYNEADDLAANLILEISDYTSLATENTTGWEAWYNKTVAGEFFYLQLEYQVTNGASAVAFTYRIHLETAAVINLDTAPSFWLYDFTNTTWRKVADLDQLANGFRQLFEYTITDADIPAGVIADYFSGDSPPEFHVKVKSGEDSTDATQELLIRCNFAELIITYSTEYGAGLTQYTIDARTATQLTFTDQTPEDDGVAVGDPYKVGDFAHTELTNAFAPAAMANLTLDIDSTTIADASDFRTAMVGDVLRSIAKLLDRRYWQQIGWTVQLKDSANYLSTGLTLGDNDLEVNQDMQKWTYEVDGNQLVRHVQVLGNGVFAEGFQNLTYPSPFSKIVNENRIASQATANKRVTNELARFNVPAVKFICTVDMDVVANHVIDIGKTISVDVFSSAIQLTNALITDVEYEQEGNGKLLCTVTIEVI